MTAHMPSTATRSRSASRTGTQARHEVLDMLKEDHRLANTAFREFEKRWAAEDVEYCARIVEQTCMQLELHTRLEEEVFYPAVRELLPELALVDEAEVEHDSARVLIQQLRRMRPGDDKYAATFHVLAEYVRHHMKEEESRLFRKLTRSAMDWPQLLDDMLTRRRQLMDELGPGGDAMHDDRVLRLNYRSEIRQ
ncbi:hemerythrin domain-containing protein [uncultured Aquabacterium sp.]|uniref:hemerythrin domain-containing protein n=1 Tax=Aquabacterium sp. TaxID=1872578 RepID=UPI0025D3A641|nr:hemerythrin domain-containing protein [uncultured Aquabacterium sp.]